jgi:hypothetical protein
MTPLSLKTSKKKGGMEGVTPRFRTGLGTGRGIDKGPLTASSSAILRPWESGYADYSLEGCVCVREREKEREREREREKEREE